MFKNKINITREQFLDFIKTPKDSDCQLSQSTQHYLNYFDKYMAEGKIVSWNWAGLLGAFWFFYRKMFALGIFVVHLEYMLGKLMSVQHIPQPDHTEFKYWLPTIIITLFSTLFGNYLYLDHASRKIRKGKNQGGTSWAYPTIYFLSIMLLSAILSIAIERAKNA